VYKKFPIKATYEFREEINGLIWSISKIVCPLAEEIDEI